MGYIEETLGQSEALIYRARFHWLHYALAWIELALILGLAVWIVFFAPNGWLQYLLLLGCAAALLLLFRSVLPFLITEIGVTNQRLIVKRGWLARSTDEIALRSIEQVNFQQGFIGRLLGYGQVDVHGTGGRQSSYSADRRPGAVREGYRGCEGQFQGRCGFGVSQSRILCLARSVPSGDAHCSDYFSTSPGQTRQLIDASRHFDLDHGATLVLDGNSLDTMSFGGLYWMAIPEKSIEDQDTQPSKSAGWKRGLFMLVFIFAFGVGQSLLYLTAIAQFLWILLAGEPNKLLVGFGNSLALWLADTARFLSCATEEKPFPWAAWP